MTGEYNPDWVSPPGDTVRDLLEEKDLSRQDLAERLHWSTEAVNQLISGEMPVDEKIASDLADLLGSTKEFWLGRERLTAIANNSGKMVKALQKILADLEKD
ncbi:MAG: transcriptional regulator [Candidatus Bipolaricaulia bacterium]